MRRKESNQTNKQITIDPNSRFLPHFIWLFLVCLSTSLVVSYPKVFFLAVKFGEYERRLPSSLQIQVQGNIRQTDQEIWVSFLAECDV